MRPPPTRLLRASLLALAGLAAGCVGSIGGDGASKDNGAQPAPGPGPGPGPSGPGGPAGPGAADPEAAGVMPMRRLTAREYDNTVRDLLGDTSAPGRDFPSDRDPGFGYRRPGVVSTLESERLRDAAERLAGKALESFATLVPCLPAAPADEAGCARRFITEFGARAFRRPLAPAEVARWTALYDNARGPLALPWKEAIGFLLEAFLQSPAFLYRWELGPSAPVREGAVIRLGPYEVASRLSYFLWSTMPDKALFEAAAAGKLGTPAEIEAQVRRMLGDEKAREGMSEFFEEWLAIGELDDRSKDPALYPEFNDALKAAMVAETRAFSSAVLLGDGDGRFRTLLTAPFTIADAALAKLYGATPKGSGAARLDLDPAQRAGILTHASFLAMTGSPDGSNPVTRGRDVYLRLLCKELPPPPPEVPAPMPASAGGTTRQRFEAHARQECAAGCHQLFEPFGYAFENYDGIGRFRTRDNDLPVDASGLAPLDGQKKPFSNARDLAVLIADSPEAQACFAKQLLRFAFRRGEADADAASLAGAVGRFAGAGHDMRELLAAFASSRTFRYRSPNPGEAP